MGGDVDEMQKVVTRCKIEAEALRHALEGTLRWGTRRQERRRKHVKINLHTCVILTSYKAYLHVQGGGHC